MPPDSCRPKPFLPLTILVMLALSTDAQALFGLDGDGGMTRYRLLPVPGWQILAAKDVPFLLASVAMTLPLAPGAGLAAALSALAAGHHASVTHHSNQVRWRVEELVGKTGMRTGLALLQSLHSTAALFVNEWQEALLEDFRTLLEQAVRADAPWRHNDPRYSDCDRSNAASHLRALLLGSIAVLAVRRGQLVRGTWQSIILAELDGPRTRSVSLQILGA